MALEIPKCQRGGQSGDDDFFLFFLGSRYRGGVTRPDTNTEGANLCIFFFPRCVSKNPKCRRGGELGSDVFFNLIFGSRYRGWVTCPDTNTEGFKLFIFSHQDCENP